jgi:hypothetical protein
VRLLPDGVLGQPEAHGKVGDGGTLGESRGIPIGDVDDEDLGVCPRLTQRGVDRGELLRLRNRGSPLGVLGPDHRVFHEVEGGRWGAHVIIEQGTTDIGVSSKNAVEKLLLWRRRQPR